MSLSVNNNVDNKPTSSLTMFDKHLVRFNKVFKYIDPKDLTAGLDLATKIDHVKPYLQTGKSCEVTHLTVNYESTIKVVKLAYESGFKWNTEKGKASKIRSYIDDLLDNLNKNTNFTEVKKNNLKLLIEDIEYFLTNSKIDNLAVRESTNKMFKEPFNQVFNIFMTRIDYLLDTVNNFKSYFRNLSKAASESLKKTIYKSNKPEKNLIDCISSNVKISTEQYKDIKYHLENFIVEIRNDLIKGLDEFNNLHFNSFDGLYYNPINILTLIEQKKGTEELEYYFKNENEWQSIFKEMHKFEDHIFNYFESLIKKFVVLDNYYNFFKSANLNEIIQLYENCESASEFYDQLEERILSFSSEYKLNPEIISRICFNKDEQQKEIAKLFLADKKSYYSINTLVLDDFICKKYDRLLDRFLCGITLNSLSQHKDYTEFKINKDEIRQNLEKELIESEIKKIKKPKNSKNKSAPSINPSKEEIDDAPSTDGNITVAPILVPTDFYKQSLDLIGKIRGLGIFSPTLSFKASAAYKNAVDQHQQLLQAMQRFLRIAKEGFTREEIAEWVILTAIKGSLILEQLYSAILLFKNVKGELSHDLLKLINGCGFNHQPLTKEELKLAFYSNYGEIDSRSIPKLARTNQANAQSKISELLIDAYKYVQENKSVCLEKLIADTVDYFTKISQSFFSLQRYLKIKPQAILEIQELKQSVTDWVQQQNLKPVNSTPQPFKSRIDQILPKETSVKMLVVKERIKNIHFMASLLESELQMIEKSTFQDLDLLQSRILMLNYLIVEESLYIKAALSVLPVSPFDIDHDLIELSKTVGYLNKFDEKEITFLKKFKETFHFMRYGNSSKSNGQVAKTTKKAKTSAKNNQPIPLASPEEGFTPVLNKQSADAGESISNYISSQTDLMESILKKLFA